MNAARIILWILTLAAAFGLGHFMAAPPQQPELSTVASFRFCFAIADSLFWPPHHVMRYLLSR